MSGTEDGRQYPAGERHHMCPRRHRFHHMMVGLCLGLFLILGPALMQTRAEPPGTSSYHRRGLVEQLAEWLQKTNQGHQSVLLRLSRPPQVKPEAQAVRAVSVLRTTRSTHDGTARLRLRLPESVAGEGLQKAEARLAEEEARRRTAGVQWGALRYQLDAVRRLHEEALARAQAEAVRKAVLVAHERAALRRRAEIADVLEMVHQARAEHVRRNAEQKRVDSAQKYAARVRRTAEALAADMAVRTISDAELRAIEAHARQVADIPPTGSSITRAAPLSMPEYEDIRPSSPQTITRRGTHSLAGLARAGTAHEAPVRRSGAAQRAAANTATRYVRSKRAARSRAASSRRAVRAQRTRRAKPKRFRALARARDTARCGSCRKARISRQVRHRKATRYRCPRARTALGQTGRR